MVAGYWLYDALLLGSLAAGAAGVPGNLIQGAFGAAWRGHTGSGAEKERLGTEGLSVPVRKRKTPRRQAGAFFSFGYGGRF